MMNRAAFIDSYVVHFIATFDANHILHVGDSEILAYKCKYADALKHAESAYERAEVEEARMLKSGQKKCKHHFGSGGICYKCRLHKVIVYAT